MTAKKKRTLPIVEELEGCAHAKEEPHSCPYKSEIGGDDLTLCTCCDSCAYECGQDI